MTGVLESLLAAGSEELAALERELDQTRQRCILLESLIATVRIRVGLLEARAPAREEAPAPAAAPAPAPVPAPTLERPYGPAREPVVVLPVRTEGPPRKPSADWPLEPHACGQWVAIVDGELRAFGPWEAPELAFLAWNAAVNGMPGAQPGRRVPPEKPSEDFPLFAHQNGQWAKKIDGRTEYFGPWDDAPGALERFHKFERTRAARRPEAAEVAAVAAQVGAVEPEETKLVDIGHMNAPGAVKQERIYEYLAANEGPVHKDIVAADLGLSRACVAQIARRCEWFRVNADATVEIARMN